MLSINIAHLTATLNSFKYQNKLLLFLEVALLLMSHSKNQILSFSKQYPPTMATLLRLFVIYFTCQRLSATPNVMSHYKLGHILKVHELQYSINDVSCLEIHL